MSTVTSTSHAVLAPAAKPPGRSFTSWELWGIILVIPYLLVFVFFVVYPVFYAFWLAHEPESYVKLVNDPIFIRSVVNTLVFLFVAINLKMAVALGLSGFFLNERWWIKIVSVLFILPWAVPSIPTILSVRFMLNPEWGIINQTIFRLTFEDGPNWLNDPKLAPVLRHRWCTSGSRCRSGRSSCFRDASRSQPTSMRPPPSTARRAAEVPLRHLAVDEAAVT